MSVVCGMLPRDALQVTGDAKAMLGRAARCRDKYNPLYPQGTMLSQAAHHAQVQFKGLLLSQLPPPLECRLGPSKYTCMFIHVCSRYTCNLDRWKLLHEHHSTLEYVNAIVLD